MYRAEPGKMEKFSEQRWGKSRNALNKTSIWLEDGFEGNKIHDKASKQN